MSLLSRATSSTRERHRNDFYRTIDPRAVAALLPFLQPGTCYAEPCAGDGDLIELLAGHGLCCAWGLELDPEFRRWPIAAGNALDLQEADCAGVDLFITNPPWKRKWLHPIIRHLVQLRPCWMLFDAPWMQTGQAAPFAGICSDIVSVGRLKWFADTEHDGTEDCAWYLFDKAKDPATPTRYHFRRTAEGQQLQLM